MIKIVLARSLNSEKIVDRIYKNLGKRFSGPLFNVETRSTPLAPARISAAVKKNNVFIYLVSNDFLNNQNWMAEFGRVTELAFERQDRLLIPLTIDPDITRPVFERLNVKEWLPLESDPREYYEDVNWIIDRIVAFGKEQSLYPEPGNLYNYWLLKINEKTWDTGGFAKGKTFVFHANHHEKQVQSDYENFKQLKKGDLVFAFVLPKTLQVVALFRVSAPLHLNNKQEEIIDLEIQNLVSPPIGLDELKGLDFFERLNYEAREKLYPVAGNIAAGLLAGHGLTEKLTVAGGFHQQRSSLTLLSPDIPLSETDDELDIMGDVRAMASVIAYKEVQPPLSIGLFGNWGSGKSFFMQKLEAEIAWLTGSDPDYYCEEIVPIRFNSWHYSDANLWASLSSRIFEELSVYGKKKDQQQLANLFSNLSSTKQQLELAQKKTDQADAAIQLLQTKYEDNEKRIRETVASLQEVKIFSLATAVFQNEDIQKEIEALKAKSDLADWDDLEAVKRQTAELKNDSGKLSAVLRQAYGFSKGKFLWALMLFALIMVAAWWLNAHPDFLKNGSSFVKQAVLWVAGIGAQALLFIRPAMKVVKQVSGKLASLGETIKKVQEAEQKKQQDKLSSLKSELAMAEVEKKVLRSEQEQLEIKKAALESELSDIRSGKKVISFIEARVIDERYVKSLGMISWVRKDFEMLDYLLKQQWTATAEDGSALPPVADTFRIDRIVLYIDDLDRCGSETVVRVLEAIHLLLAIPLFVVIVGVDPRWMETALTSQFIGQFGQTGAEAVSPAAYLEKIFQIPFRLKPVSSAGFKDLVASQFLEEEEHESTEPQIVPAPPAGPPGNSAPMPGLGQKPTPVPAPTKVSPEMLAISSREIKFMQELSGIIPNSPRAIKRYVNIYRIMRSHSDFNFNSEKEDMHYQAVMIMLAILTAQPLTAKQFFGAINQAGPALSFKDFLQSPEVKNQFPGFPVTLLDIIEQTELLKHAAAIPVSCFSINTELVSRFSFYDL